MKADFLGRQQRVTIVEQFQTPDWTLDFQEAEVRARILGFPPPGWASAALIRGKGESAWYGNSVSRGAFVCTPPGEAIDGWIGPGFQCSSIGVPPPVWEQCRRSAGRDETSLEAVVVALPPPQFAAMEGCLLTLRQSLREACAPPYRSRRPGSD